jgi:hypothetical protein
MENNDVVRNIIIDTAISKKDLSYKSIRLPLHHILNSDDINGVKNNDILLTKLSNINHINQRVKAIITNIANNFISLYYCWIYEQFLSFPNISPISYDINFINKSNGRQFLRNIARAHQIEMRTASFGDMAIRFYKEVFRLKFRQLDTSYISDSLDYAYDTYLKDYFNNFRGYRKNIKKGIDAIFFKWTLIYDERRKSPRRE